MATRQCVIICTHVAVFTSVVAVIDMPLAVSMAYRSLTVYKSPSSARHRQVPQR